MTAILMLLALVLIAVMVVWLVRDMTRTLRRPRWPTSREDKDL